MIMPLSDFLQHTKWYQIHVDASNLNKCPDLYWGYIKTIVNAGCTAAAGGLILRASHL